MALLGRLEVAYTFLPLNHLYLEFLRKIFLM